LVGVFVCADWVLVSAAKICVLDATRAVCVTIDGGEPRGKIRIPSKTMTTALTINAINIRLIGERLFFGSCMTLISISSLDQDARMPGFN
jgi:hypothetical protein